MTSELLKYVLRGALKGIEEYEAMMNKDHVDPSGKMAEIIEVPKQDEPKETSSSIDIDDLFEEVS